MAASGALHRAPAFHYIRDARVAARDRQWILYDEPQLVEATGAALGRGTILCENSPGPEASTRWGDTQG
jgi:hypothetical protein